MVVFSPQKQGYIKAAASHLLRGQLPPLTVPYPGTIHVMNTHFYQCALIMLPCPMHLRACSLPGDPNGVRPDVAEGGAAFLLVQEVSLQ